jgi:hypothetical protein
MNGMETKARLDEDRDLEKILEELVPRLVPAGLKSRVLESANAVRREVVMTSRMWAVAAACLVIIFVAVAGDRIISKSQVDGLFAPVGRSASTAPSDEEIRPVLAELGVGEKALEGESGEKSFLVRNLISRMGPGSESPENLSEILKTLEGWYDDEGTENLY